MLCTAKMRAEGPDAPPTPSSESLVSPPKGPTPRRGATPRISAALVPLVGVACWGDRACAPAWSWRCPSPGTGNPVSVVTRDAQLKLLAIGLFVPHSVHQARFPSPSFRLLASGDKARRARKTQANASSGPKRSQSSRGAPSSPTQRGRNWASAGGQTPKPGKARQGGLGGKQFGQT